jgi:hypothetical protein
MELSYGEVGLGGPIGDGAFSCFDRLSMRMESYIDQIIVLLAEPVEA